MADATSGYELDTRPGTIVARLTEPEVTHLIMQELCEELGDKVRYDNVRRFVLDMTDVRFMPSACLGALVGFLQDLEHVRGQVLLAGCADNVAFIFKVTRLDSVFPLYDDVDEALAAAA